MNTAIHSVYKIYLIICGRETWEVGDKKLTTFERKMLKRNIDPYFYTTI